ncbi:hypothetical protein [Pseudomarimonas arenosa]|uniref:Intracellular septation protein A n=1 Tax=Pseudomarimonas arenosa TaxID=2774145 RepID=A0AAW3ZPX7_9GAMM|nr:hypothetical protein [Pseudomarimonas arenosa]MBD8528240.1 hypothetical protein [Pseudomarimonas arenosa]
MNKPAEQVMLEELGSDLRRVWTVTFRRHWQPICTALISVGGLWVALGLFGAIERDGAFMLLGLFLFAYAGLVLLSRLPPNVLGKRVDERLERWVASSGAGFYGLMTTVRFAQLELADLIDALGSIGSHMQSWVWELITGISIDAIMNSIKAFMWPVDVMKEFGLIRAAILVAPLWALYITGAKAFPRMHAKLDKEAEQVDVEAENAESTQKSDQADTASTKSSLASVLPSLPSLPSLPTLGRRSQKPPEGPPKPPPA